MKNINFRLWLMFYTSKFATKILSLDIGGTETKFKAPLGPLHGALKALFGKKSKNTFGFLSPTAEIDFPFFS